MPISYKIGRISKLNDWDNRWFPISFFDSLYLKEPSIIYVCASKEYLDDRFHSTSENPITDSQIIEWQQEVLKKWLKKSSKIFKRNAWWDSYMTDPGFSINCFNFIKMRRSTLQLDAVYVNC